ncbi:MAG: hypothetical protein RLZZ161_1439, partial [Bacteroidota bacterium]
AGFDTRGGTSSLAPEVCNADFGFRLITHLPLDAVILRHCCKPVALNFSTLTRFYRPGLLITNLIGFLFFVYISTIYSYPQRRRPPQYKSQFYRYLYSVLCRKSHDPVKFICLIINALTIFICQSGNNMKLWINYLNPEEASAHRFQTPCQNLPK